MSILYYQITNKTKIILIKLFDCKKSEHFLKYSHHELKVKLKNIYEKIYTECLSEKWLVTKLLGLRVSVIPCLKSVNTSLFILLLREGFIILIKHASKIFHLKVFLRTIDNNDQWTSWLKCSGRCLLHSQFFSITLSCAFHLLSTLPFVSPVWSEQTPL